MKEKKKSEVLQGYFDVKKFQKGVERSARPLLTGDDTIAFVVTFEKKEAPKELLEFAREYQGKDGMDRVAVKFKISKNVKWYDGKTYKEMKKPVDERNTYSQLDGKRFEVVAQYVTLRGDVAKAEPNGFWANAILVKEIEENPFLSEAQRAGVSFEKKAKEEEEVEVANDIDDLPF